MSSVSAILNESLRDYTSSLSALREDDVLRRLRERTAQEEMARMQISVEQGRFMAMLCKLTGAQKAVEVGVFTGYSALCVAQQLPADGRLVACDVSEEWTSIAKPFWEEAKVQDRIDLRLGPASDTLQAMLDAGEAGDYDFAFIDADKEAYPDYFEKCLKLMKPGGLITLDNIFLGGNAVKPEDRPSPKAMHKLTREIMEDPRVDASLIPIGDGLLLARKR